MNKYTMIMQSNQCTDYENINYSIDVIAKEWKCPYLFYNSIMISICYENVDYVFYAMQTIDIILHQYHIYFSYIVAKKNVIQ